MKFLKVKLPCLKGLELDGYNEENGIAFEYQGIQHYIHQPHFQRNGENDFYEQIKRDKIKVELCSKNNIKLLIVPYKFDYRTPLKLEEYIRQQLALLNIRIIN